MTTVDESINKGLNSLQRSGHEEKEFLQRAGFRMQKVEGKRLRTISPNPV